MTSAAVETTPDAIKSLPEKTQRFIDEYVLSLNITQAAVLAGYSKNSAAQQGSRLFRNVQIKTEIDRRLDAIKAKSEWKLEHVLGELKCLVHADTRKLFNTDGTLKSPGQWDDATAKAVGTVEITDITNGNDILSTWTKKVKMIDKKGAIDIAMRYFGGYKTDHEQANPVAELLKGLRERGARLTIR